MILPFAHAVQAFLTIWFMLPFAIRAMMLLFLVISLLVTALDILTTRT